METLLSTRILDWLRAGYPQGIPHRDYVPLLGVLHRRLTVSDIDMIAGELAAQADANGEPISGDDIVGMVREHVFQSASAEDINRVSAQLASGGWPLADDIA